MASNEVEIRVTSRDSSGPGFAAAQRRASGLGDTLKNVGKVAAGFLAANVVVAGAQKFTGFLKESVAASTNLGESLNAVGKVFGSSSKTVLDWGKNNAASFGLSQRAFNALAVPLGAALKNAGLSMRDVTGRTVDLTKRAADMASVFNVDVATAMEAIQAGLRGESDPLEKFGVGLSAAKVEAQAFAETGKKTAEALTDQEKMTARLNLIMKQTNDTAGDFTDTSDGLANAQRIAAAKTEDLQAKLGDKLVPVALLATRVKLGLVTVLVDKLIPAFDKVKTWVGLAAAAFRDADVTSNGLEGAFERLGVFARRVYDGMLLVIGAFRDGDVTSNGLHGALERVGVMARWVYDRVVEFGGWIIDHKELVVAAFLSVAAAVVAVHVAAAAFTAVTAAMAAVASPAALLSGALTLVAAGFMFAYTHSQTFRDGVNGALLAVYELVTRNKDNIINLGLVIAEWGLKAAAVVLAFAAGWAGLTSAIMSGSAMIVRAVVGIISTILGLLTHLPVIGDKFKGAKEAVDRFGVNAVGKLEGAAAGARGVASAAAAAATKAWNLANATKAIRDRRIVLELLDRATAGLRNIIRLRNEAGRAVSIQAGTGSGPAVRGEAHGGIIGAAFGGVHGGLRMVGEAGRELVRLPYGSTVVPNGQTEAMLAGAGRGGNTYHISVTVAPGGHPADVGGQIVDLIRRFEQRSGPGWRTA